MPRFPEKQTDDEAAGIASCCLFCILPSLGIVCSFITAAEEVRKEYVLLPSQDHKDEDLMQTAILAWFLLAEKG